MSQKRIYPSHAARQAAYRARRECARQAALEAKGLPPLPAIATVPAWPRWRSTFAAATQLLTNSLTEMQDYFDLRSQSWQESDRGEKHQEQIALLEAALEALGELSG